MGLEGPLSHMNYVFLHLSESHESLIIVSKFNENTMFLLWTMVLEALAYVAHTRGSKLSKHSLT